MYPVRRTTVWIAIFVFAAACEGEKPVGGPVSKTPQIAEKPFGTVSSVSSNQKPGVEILKKGKADWTTANGNVSIFAGDKIRTDGASAATLRLDLGSMVALGGNAAVEAAPSSIKLEKGELWIDAKSPLRVETADGAAEAKSGSGGIRYANRQMTVSWISGSAVLLGKNGTAGLNAGDEATADANGVRKTIIKDPSSLVAWTDKVRQAVSPSSTADGKAAAPPLTSPPTGLGTLTAKLPGGSKPLPFRILTEDVQVHIQDNIAVTRVEQVFQNPTAQVVEAEYKFPIPQNASLTGYDMEINGRMMKGEIVEREKGRKILKKVIDDYLYLMRDPALTEWESGSTFKTRIFPVQPNEQKRIVLTHLMPLEGAAGDYRYVLPVTMGAVDSPTISKFRITATVASSLGAPTVTTPVYDAKTEPSEKGVIVGFAADSFVPRADFVMSIRTPSARDASLAIYAGSPDTAHALIDPAAGPGIQLTGLNTFMRAGGENLFLLRLSPTFDSEGGIADAAANGADWIFLVDTSESRFGPDMEVEKRMVAALIDTLGPQDRVKVIGFDTFPVLMDSVWTAPCDIAKKKAAEFLSRVEPGGASNLGDALALAAAQNDSNRPLRVLILGDGSSTLGVTTPSALSDLAARLFPYPHSVSAVGIGSSVDKLALEAVTRPTRGRTFQVSSGEDLFAAAVRIALSLRRPVLESPELLLSGLETSDMVPARMPNLSSGEDLLVAGKISGKGTLTVSLSGMLGGKPWKKEWSFDVGEASSSNSFVPLVYGAKKIDALALDDGDASRRETVTLSKKYGIASRLTSFIVLENDAMYREFNVEQNDKPTWSGNEEIDYENPNEVFEPENIEASGPSDKDAASGAMGGGEKRGAGLGSGYGRGEGGYAESKAKRSAPKPAKSYTDDEAPAPSAPLSKAPLSKAPLSKAPLSEPPLPIENAKRPAPTRSFDDRTMDCGEWGCGGSFGYDHDYYIPPRPSWNISIRQPASAPSAASMDRARDLAARVQAAPMDRRVRKALVSELLSDSLLDEAERALAEWAALDRSNPEVHLMRGDLLRRKGTVAEALRAYSSVIDLQPENSRILSSLAAYFEAHERWNEAYPFRLSLAAVKPKDFSLKAALATVALKAGRTDEAAAATAEMTEADRSGYPVLKRGIALSKAESDTVLSIRSTGSLPLLFDTAAADLRSAGLKVSLVWDRPVKLDLWMSTNKDKYVGGAFGAARLLANVSGKEKVFFVSGAALGRYRAQVVCAEPTGCDGTTGTLTVDSHGKRRVIPFVIQGSLGIDAAVIRVDKNNPDMYW